MSVDPLQSNDLQPFPDAGASGSRVEQEGERVEAPPSGTISADRLREVVDRLQSNFYERPEVRDRIARCVAQDLGIQETE
jgi:hypothetical protein